MDNLKSCDNCIHSELCNYYCDMQNMNGCCECMLDICVSKAKDCRFYLSSDKTEEIEIVKIGEWKLCFEDWRKQIEGDECSVCGYQFYGFSIAHYKYCPNCGAKMVEVK